MSDGRKNNHGKTGNKGGSGRPPLPPELKNPRKIRTMRLYDDEYDYLRDCIKKYRAEKFPSPRGD